jgi:hypothetical protein
LDENIRTSLAEVELGVEVEKFFKSNLGKYIIGVSEQEAQEAADELKEVAPNDTGKIIELQIKAQTAEKAVKWLAEAVLRGRQAEHAIYEMEAESENG